ncbi:GTPase HflX [Oceanobacillus manasiensis]|uniref:GTPase HflX n=1 Tax=Oceanobacillus manasiensis TaxID=586413 RepID=UPI0005AA6D41|nr:GTPase HflX [Oceanobacillus manasiensis]
MSEKILIIAVINKQQNEIRFQSSLDELISLSETAGGKVETVMTQNRDRIDPAHYIGKGKMEEIKEAIQELDIDLVISNDELSAGQLRNLGAEFGVRIIDRSQLILDIFAQRARTKEGKLQVELAQLEYTLPRLRGQGIEMSRLGAGIGTRGPGETKLESDQRHIRRRIYDIKRRLETIVQQREQYRKRRKSNEAFQIAIVGYTNAGKSTLFNRMTNSSSLEENQLFATLDPLTRQLQLPSGFQALVTDTVGFMQDLPTALIAAFRSTLEEVKEADFLLHVVDVSHPDQEQQQDTVIKLLDELDAGSIPMLTIYNKEDRLNGEEVIPMQHPYFFMSAYKQEDIEKMLIQVEAVLQEIWQPYNVQLNPEDGKQLNKLEQGSLIMHKEFDESINRYILQGYIKQDHPLRGFLEE